jgi:formate dehydrogenase iron-sulfur subunit
VADIFRHRVLKRNKGAEVCGWSTAYGSKQAGQAPAKVEGVKKS